MKPSCKRYRDYFRATVELPGKRSKASDGHEKGGGVRDSSSYWQAFIKPFTRFEQYAALRRLSECKVGVNHNFMPLFGKIVSRGKLTS